jgi:hypothetical protein
MHNYVLKKKNKKRKHFTEHRVHANPPPKAHAQSPTAAGMREHNRSVKPDGKKKYCKKF